MHSKIHGFSLICPSMRRHDELRLSIRSTGFQTLPNYIAIHHDGISRQKFQFAHGDKTDRQRREISSVVEKGLEKKHGDEEVEEEEEERKQRNDGQIYRPVCAICDIPAREVAAHSLEETKCRPTSAAATRNFVTPLPSCNDDALSWISTRFPPVSDRLSIRGASKLPPTPNPSGFAATSSSSSLSFSSRRPSLPRGQRKKLSFSSIRGVNKDDLYA